MFGFQCLHRLGIIEWVESGCPGCDEPVPGSLWSEPGLRALALEIDALFRGQRDIAVLNAQALREDLQQRALAEKAETHAATVMPGFTHLQVAQPVTFGHHMLAYVEMLARDRSRLADARRRAA